MHVLLGGESASGEVKKNAMFYSETMNVNMENMIILPATNLDSTNGGSVMEYAVQYAVNAFTFSHQQHSFVYSYAEKQILRLKMQSSVIRKA